jgi:FAD/FMN-containing dehydrogenase
MPISETLLSEFRAAFRGPVLTPNDDAYDASRQVWNGTVAKRPAVIARCQGVAGVIASVRFAAAAGLGVAVRGGGHHVSGSSLLEGGLVVDLSLMRSVRVDPVARTVRAEGGATIGDVDRETHALGLAVPLGVVSETGIGGLTLAGGMGWLRRKHGMSCDNLLSADVVTAGGDLVHASPSENPDLYWALRGGG